MTRTPRSLFLLLVIAMTVLAMGLLPGCARKERNALATQSAQDLAKSTASELTHRMGVFHALSVATRVVAQSVRAPAIDDLDLRERLVDAVHDERWEDAILYNAYWDADFGDADAQEAEVRLMLYRQQYEQGRARAWGLLSSFPEQQERWVPLWYDAWQVDPNVWRPAPYDMIRGRDYKELRRLGGGSTVSLKVKNAEDQTIGMIKPHSELGQTYYRGEIAAYRLCAIMKCGFDVPRNIETRFQLKEFLRAYGVRSLDNRSKGYARRFSDIIVFEDDEGAPWIHATFKDWVPGYTTFPVEHVDGWIHLLNGYIPLETLEEMTLEEALQPMRGKEREDVRGMLARNEEGTDALDFARQLSNLHVFDFLMNNWDRYSTVFWGVNTHWNHGRFVSIDNGASFQPRSNGTVALTRSRLHVIRRFSKSTVFAIRVMDRERTRALLFPDSAHHPGEAARFDNFWERREEFLAWIDTLIERRGETLILSLP